MKLDVPWNLFCMICVAVSSFESVYMMAVPVCAVKKIIEVTCGTVWYGVFFLETNLAVCAS